MRVVVDRSDTEQSLAIASGFLLFGIIASVSLAVSRPREYERKRGKKCAY